MLRRMTLPLVVVVACTCLVLAAPPDFSGKWTLNKDQSDFRTRDGENRTSR